MTPSAPFAIRKIHWIWLLLLFVIASASRQVVAQSTLDPSSVVQQDTERTIKAQQFLDSLPNEWVEHADRYIVQGEILVGMHSGQAAIVKAADTLAAYNIKLISSFNLPASKRHPAITVQRWAVAEGAEWATIAALQSESTIDYAEPNWIVRAAKVATTTLPYDQPYLPNDTLYQNTQWHLQRINASRAWSLLYASGAFTQVSPVAVGVIDSGIDFSHPEFAGRLQAGFNFVNNTSDPNLEDCSLPIGPLVVPEDGYGHGTHVAGLLAADLNNGSGIASLAPFVTIHSLRVLNNNGSGSVADVALAIRYAALCLDVDIINLSLEVPASTIVGNSTLNQTFQTAVSLADSRNILQIAAGGNKGGHIVPYPAAYAEVMGVSALTYDNKKASYSTSGDGIDIAAPGGEITAGAPRIYSTWSKEAAAKCTSAYLVVGGGAFCNDVGTSMSAPLVASVAALLWAIRPELNKDEVWSILLDTATPLGLPSEEVGAGRLDAHLAVRGVLPADLILESSSMSFELSEGSPLVEADLRIDNPSLVSIPWTASISPLVNWVGLNDLDHPTVSGTVMYGTPAQVSIVLSPTYLPTGTHNVQIAFAGQRADSTSVTKTVAISLSVIPNVQSASSSANPGAVAFLPIISMDAEVLVQPIPSDTPTQQPIPTTLATPTSTATPSNTPTVTPTFTPTPSPTATAIKVTPVEVSLPSFAKMFVWENPIDESERTTYTFVASESVAIALPVTFTFPMKDAIYSDFRIHPDGFVTFPAQEQSISLPNHCLPDTSRPGQAIYGWWADLDPAAANARISTFMPNPSTFVIEFRDVPSVNVLPGYTVSFQIALYRNGDIGLNYLAPPHLSLPLPPATLGVEVQDGLFAWQVACSTPSQVIGYLPKSNQSYLITPSLLH